MPVWKKIHDGVIGIGQKPYLIHFIGCLIKCNSLVLLQYILKCCLIEKEKNTDKFRSGNI